MRRFAAAVLIAVAACGGGTPMIEGIVIAVDGDLTTVTSFTVRASNGEIFDFVPSPDGDFAFPLPHLSEHFQTSSPVLVGYQESDDGSLVATSIDDAGESHG